MTTPVRMYVDFVSPYSWLALMRSQQFASREQVAFELHPVVYAKLLDAHGLVGPAEIPAKRSYTFQDIARCAAREGLRLTGPPAHPFRSLEALRTACLFRDDPRLHTLCVALADAAWGEGRDLADVSVLEGVVAGLGLDAADLADRIRTTEIKQRLVRETGDALRAGIFGVPTFVLRGERFWGSDRMQDLAERLHGTPAPSPEFVERILRRPRAADRWGAPSPPE